MITIKDSTSKVPDKRSSDYGYASGNNFDTLEKAGIHAYVAAHQGEQIHTQEINNSECLYQKN